MDEKNLHTESEELHTNAEETLDEPTAGEARDSTEDAVETAENEPKTPEKRPGQNLFEWSQALAISICAIVIIFTFFARVIGVDGDSMNPTLIDQDRLIISNLFYTPSQGDIVVLHAENYTDPLIKRIIATEGQTIRLEPSADYSNGSVYDVYVNGTRLEEDYIAEPIVKSYDTPTATDIVVPEGCVFVMGDNRNHSSDSRSDSVGMVDERQIIGRAVWRLFPIDSFGGI